MDGCLACKSCVGQCPIKVDVPAFRSRFLELYYGRYLRPAKDRLVASLERMLPWMARTPTMANAVVSSGLGRAALAKLGLVALPSLDAGVLRLLSERGVRQATPDALARIPAEQRAKNVVIVQDAFTSYYDPTVVVDFCDLISRLGFTPWVAPFKPNGKPQHVLGFLGAFERTARDNAAMLSALAATGVELVGVDPSMTLAYRAEYVKALGKDLAPAVSLPQEWLARHVDALPQFDTSKPDRWAFLPHCTERTNAPRSVADWQRVARQLGVDLVVLPSGCCGMAGLYGHEKANRARSEAIYRLSWANHLADPDYTGRIVATGYSCRTQAKIVDSVRLMHPVQLLLARVKASRGKAVARERAAESATAHHEEY
jgi:Fe-S oxidoreductase